MCFATKKAQCLRERMAPRRPTTLPNMPAPLPAAAGVAARMSQIEEDRKSKANLRASMITTPRPLQWWEKEVVEYAFSHPRVRYRLEKWMGSNVTRLTDRVFMQRLAERIQEEHVVQMQKRIRNREEAEVEREKKLILEGKIPVEQVPQQLADHPVFKIHRMTSEAIEIRRSKVHRLSMRPSYIPAETLMALAKAVDHEKEEESEDEDKDSGPPAPPSEEIGHEGEEEEEEGEEVEGPEIIEIFEIGEEGETEGETEGEEEGEEEVKGEIREEEEEGLEGEEEPSLEILKSKMESESEEEGVRKKKKKSTKMSIRLQLKDEASEELEGEETDEHPFDNLSDILDYSSSSSDDMDDEEKRQAVLRESRRLKSYRQSRLTTKGGLSMYTEDGRQLSDDEIQRERMTMERASLMTAARNEWQAEAEMQEAMERDRDRNYVMSERDLRRLRYEAPLIEELRKQETVADLYRLADEIVGGLWTKTKTEKEHAY